MGRIPCNQCRAIYADEETPCSTCWPGIHRYNELAIKVFEQCMNQYIYSSSGAVGLDLKAVWLVFDMMNIPNDERLDLWGKLQTIADSLLSEVHRDAEEKRQRANNG